MNSKGKIGVFIFFKNHIYATFIEEKSIILHNYKNLDFTKP